MITVDDPRLRISERELQTAIVELAEYLGWLTYHTYDSRRSNPGFPDLVLVRDRRLVFAELKSTHGSVTAAQRRWLEALDVRGEAYVWRPREWLDGTVEGVLRRVEVISPDEPKGTALADYGRTCPVCEGPMSGVFETCGCSGWT